MPRYDFKGSKCSAVVEIKASFNEELDAPSCCQQPMSRDYTNDVAGFIPSAGMYSRDNR